MVAAEIPVFEVAETGGVTVKKGELRTAIVEIGVNIILLGDAGELAVIEKPNGAGRSDNGTKSYLIA